MFKKTSSQKNQVLLHNCVCPGNGEKQEVDSSMLLDNLVGMEDSQPSKEDLDLLNNILGNEETSGKLLLSGW